MVDGVFGRAFVFLTLVLTIAAGAVVCQDDQMNQCFETVAQRGDLSIELFNRDSCEFSIFDGSGFVVLERVGKGDLTKVLWGEASIDAERTYFSIHDLNDDGINELLTLYAFETTVWGYVHRFKFEDSRSVRIETTAIPDSLTKRLEFSGEVEWKNGQFSIGGYSTGSIQAIVIGVDPQSDKIQFRKGM